MNPPMTGKILADRRLVDERAHAIMAAKGIAPDELVILAGHLLATCCDDLLSQAYGGWANGEKEYQRDYRRIVKAAMATGIHPVRGNACAMAWAMRIMQETDLVVQPTGGRQE